MVSISLWGHWDALQIQSVLPNTVSHLSVAVTLNSPVKGQQKGCGVVVWCYSEQLWQLVSCFWLRLVSNMACVVSRVRCLDESHMVPVEKWQRIHLWCMTLQWIRLALIGQMVLAPALDSVMHHTKLMLIEILWHLLHHLQMFELVLCLYLAEFRLSVFKVWLSSLLSLFSSYAGLAFRVASGH